MNVETQIPLELVVTPIGNALFQVLMCSYIIENNKLKMFSMLTTGGLGLFDTMFWVICKHFASHEPNKSLVCL